MVDKDNTTVTDRFQHKLSTGSLFWQKEKWIQATESRKNSCYIVSKLGMLIFKLTYWTWTRSFKQIRTANGSKLKEKEIWVVPIQLILSLNTMIRIMMINNAISCDHKTLCRRHSGKVCQKVKIMINSFKKHSRTRRGNWFLKFTQNWRGIQGGSLKIEGTWNVLFKNNGFGS